MLLHGTNHLPLFQTQNTGLPVLRVVLEVRGEHLDQRSLLVSARQFADNELQCIVDLYHELVTVKGALISSQYLLF